MIELLSTLYKIFLMMVGFSVLVFVHELGHFVAARWAGIRTEGFAIGMGPAVLTFRKGVGFCLGSSHKAVVEKTGRAAHQLSDSDLKRFGIGETEYSLRALPLGGFVKMLGQEDGNPNAVSDDPRSYTQCSTGKRMIVVSAGVIMNVILAAILFMIVFAVGVPMPAPVVGLVQDGAPAARAVAVEAEALGIEVPGLQPGDRVTAIDGNAVETFADIEIAAALGRPDRAIEFTVERPSIAEPLTFNITPEPNEASGRLFVGIAPAKTTTISRDRQRQEYFNQSNWPSDGLAAGMSLTSIEGREVSTLTDVDAAFAASDGATQTTVWHTSDREGNPTGAPVEIEIEPNLGFMVYQQSTTAGELGLLGMTPLVQIQNVLDDSPNAGVLQDGDVILEMGTMHGPRRQHIIDQVAITGDGDLPVTVLRNGESVDVTARVERGRIGILMAEAYELPRIGPVIDSYAWYDDDGTVQEGPTAVSPLALPPLTSVIAVNSAPVEDWFDIWRAVHAAAAEAVNAGTDAALTLTVRHATQGGEEETLDLTLSGDELERTAELTWMMPMSTIYFDEAKTIRKAEGNPLVALSMGVDETRKALIQTYLTLDRVIRGSVSVRELRGPVGIVHVGVTIFDRGPVYLLLLMAVISVNLAVINFLPLPIVDGGLFLFLIYERFKGRPPSIGFQNIVTICGLCLIGSLFVMVTWNDVVRLFGS